VECNYKRAECRASTLSPAARQFAIRSDDDKGNRLKNVLNKKEDSRAMSCWAEANKSRSAGISITRRPSPKACKKVKQKTVARKSGSSRSSAILDQQRFYYAPRYSVECRLMYFRLRLYSAEYAARIFLIAHTRDDAARRARKKRLNDVDKKRREGGGEGRRGNGAKM